MLIHCFTVALCHRLHQPAAFKSYRQVPNQLKTHLKPRSPAVMEMPLSAMLGCRSESNRVEPGQQLLGALKMQQAHSSVSDWFIFLAYFRHMAVQHGELRGRGHFKNEKQNNLPQ